MNKIREAFYAIKPDGTEAEYVLYYAGYQAAIADVRAGGPDARVALTHGSLVGILEYRINAGTPLYKLPEET